AAAPASLDPSAGAVASDSDSGTADAASAPHEPLTGVAEVAVGDHTTCLRMVGGEVLCAGWVYEVDLPGPTPGTVKQDAWDVPRPVGVSDAISLAMGWGYQCAVRRDRTVACWGMHDRYARSSDKHPGRELRTIPGIHDAAQVALGMMHVCVLS